MKKKNKAFNAAAKEQRIERRREAERLSEKGVMITALAILYGVLLLFLQSMGKSDLAAGATGFLSILRWVSIAGAIFFAAWSVYKERRGLMLYCGIFVYIIWSITIVLNTTSWDKSFAIVYVSLFAAIVFTHVNIWLRSSGRFESKAFRVSFAVVSIAVFVVLNLLYIELRYGLFSKLLGR